MLPSHLLDSNLRRNERPSHTRLGDAPPPPLPSLCVTGAMCTHGRLELMTNHNNISLSYCIFRPRQLKDVRKPPLIVIHGGPSIPSNYLLPIVNGVVDRAIVFYDQWGCGKSSRPPPQQRRRQREVTMMTIIIIIIISMMILFHFRLIQWSNI